jgi:putative tryptophan/tyrosine transport system substrate-binding protein
MRRREVMTLLGGAAAAWPLAVRAQQPVPSVIGLLSARSPAVDVPLIAVIRQSLNDAGFVEGRNVALDYRWADGQLDRLPRLAADFVRQQVAVIVTMGGEASAVAAKAATATIPIVFVTGGDPIRSGLVTSLRRPGANSTGVSMSIVDMEAKRLGLLRELRPNASTTAVLVNPANIAQVEMQMSDIQTAANSIGQKIAILNARSAFPWFESYQAASASL